MLRRLAEGCLAQFYSIPLFYQSPYFPASYPFYSFFPLLSSLLLPLTYCRQEHSFYQKLKLSKKFLKWCYQAICKEQIQFLVYLGLRKVIFIFKYCCLTISTSKWYLVPLNMILCHTDAKMLSRYCVAKAVVEFFCF